MQLATGTTPTISPLSDVTFTSSLQSDDAHTKGSSVHQFDDFHMDYDKTVLQNAG